MRIRPIRTPGRVFMQRIPDFAVIFNIFPILWFQLFLLMSILYNFVADYLRFLLCNDRKSRYPARRIPT